MLCKRLAYCTLWSEESRIALTNCKVMEYVPTQWWSKQFVLLLCCGQHNYWMNREWGILILSLLSSDYESNSCSLSFQRVWRAGGGWSLFMFTVILFSKGLVTVAVVMLPCYCHVGIWGLPDMLAMNYKYTGNISVELQRRFWKEVPKLSPSMLTLWVNQNTFFLMKCDPSLGL